MEEVSLLGEEDPFILWGDTSNRYAARNPHLGGTTVDGAVVPLWQAGKRATRTEGEEVHALGRYYRR